jgi:hypothetical protein
VGGLQNSDTSLLNFYFVLVGFKVDHHHHHHHQSINLLLLELLLLLLTTTTTTTTIDYNNKWEYYYYTFATLPAAAPAIHDTPTSHPLHPDGFILLTTF